MKHLRLLSLLALVSLVLSPVAAFAQEGPEMKEFTSEDEMLTVSYPAGWSIADSTADSGLPSVTIANSEDALARSANGEDLVSGDAEILVLLLPSDAFTMLGAELPTDGSPADLAQTVADFLIGAPDPTATEQPQTQTGKAEEVELGDKGPTAGYLTVTSDTAEGALIVYELQDGVLAITIAAAYPGEFNDDLNTLGLAVAGGISYKGTADDLLTLMMGGPTPEATAPAGTESSPDGASLVTERCTGCHSAARIDAAHKDEAGWTQTVDRMIGYGAQLDQAERQALIDYLVATH